MESAEQEAPDSVVEKARIEQWAMSYAKKKLDDINQQAEEVPGWSKQEARKQIEILSNRIKDDFDRSANRVLAPLFQKYLMALIRLEDFSGSKNFDQAES